MPRENVKIHGLKKYPLTVGCFPRSSGGEAYAAA